MKLLVYLKPKILDILKTQKFELLVKNLKIETSINGYYIATYYLEANTQSSEFSKRLGYIVKNFESLKIITDYKDYRLYINNRILPFEIYSFELKK